MRPPTLYHLSMYDDAAGFLRTSSRCFAWVAVDVMESSAWCGLSINARRVMDRLLVENVRHKSETNGRLRVSARQFEEHGINRRLVSGAVKELVDAGLLAVTNGKGRASQHPPNLYRITFLSTLNGPATWQKPEESNVVALPAKPPKARLKDAKPMPSEKLFSTPRRYDGTTPRMYDGEGHFPPSKVRR